MHVKYVCYFTLFWLFSISSLHAMEMHQRPAPTQLRLRSYSLPIPMPFAAEDDDVTQLKTLLIMLGMLQHVQKQTIPHSVTYALQEGLYKPADVIVTNILLINHTLKALRLLEGDSLQTSSQEPTTAMLSALFSHFAQPQTQSTFTNQACETYLLDLFINHPEQAQQYVSATTLRIFLQCLKRNLIKALSAKDCDIKVEKITKDKPATTKLSTPYHLYLAIDSPTRITQCITSLCDQYTHSIMSAEELYNQILQLLTPPTSRSRLWTI
ncbi:hypothetical protein FJ364_00305 [Candidatus Dependentiae bacterium]|nr:hypothetical protein [Candidatus Dependentiae bacterium]